MKKIKVAVSRLLAKKFFANSRVRSYKDIEQVLKP